MEFRFHGRNPIIKSTVSSLLSSRISLDHSSRSKYPYLRYRFHPCWVFSDDPGYSISRRWHSGHSHDHHQNHHHHHHHDVSGKEGEKIFRLGLAADIGLSAGKALTGYLSGSTAIIADAAHSVSDVVLSGVALVSFKAANAPRDEEHPYGHGKFETLGALGISCMLLGTGCGIAWHAIDLLFGLLSSAPEVFNHSLTHEHVHSHPSHSGHHHGIDMEHPVLALSMTISSISIKEGLYWMTKRAGERQGSGLMKANAWHHRADAISSVVALIGVGGSILGVRFLDPLAGLVVSGMILKAGIESGCLSVLELVDAAIPSQQLDPIRQTILMVEGVKGCHRLRGRKAGSFLHLDVHIVVNPFSSVSAAHEVGENVRQQIHQNHPEVSEVFIHIDPAFIESSPSGVAEASCETRTSIKNLSGDIKDVEATVSDVLSSKFQQKISVERITPHLLQGMIFLQVEVSMPPDMTIGDAMEAAKEAEEEILKSVKDISHVSIQLRLGNPLPET